MANIRGLCFHEVALREEIIEVVYCVLIFNYAVQEQSRVENVLYSVERIPPP